MAPAPAAPAARIDTARFRALLFDLDGVITQSMHLHARAWKRLFDAFLERHAAATGEPFVPFDVAADYRPYVDGKPRYLGVRSFLESRGIDLPEGDPADGPDRQTVCGLGNRKDLYFQEELHTRGVDIYRSSVDFIRAARQRGLKTAVVSSSRNCRQVLDVVGIADLFDTIVDGVAAEEGDLAGKPAPDTFLEAARHLGVTPERAVVFEDAISGVQAGAEGGFGLVVGVDRLGHPDDLRLNGAHVVVADLAELTLA